MSNLLKADDLTEDQLREIGARLLPVAEGFKKSDVTPILTKMGLMPERVHGKKYAETQVGRILDRLKRMGWVEKAGSGKWQMIAPVQIGGNPIAVAA